MLSLSVNENYRIRLVQILSEYKSLKSIVVDCVKILIADFELSDDDLLPMLSLAREYQAESIRIKCEQYITMETDAGMRNIEGKTTRGEVPTPNKILLYIFAIEEYDLNIKVVRQELINKLAFGTQCNDIQKSVNYGLFHENGLVETLMKKCKRLEKYDSPLKSIFEQYKQLREEIPNAQRHQSHYIGNNKCTDCLNEFDFKTIKTLESCNKCAPMKLRILVDELMTKVGLKL